jgi:(2S)-methylsuccinyl-CoA dehydrogenase
MLETAYMDFPLDATPALEDVARLIDVAGAALDRAIGHGRALTNNGRDIDSRQVHSERLAYLTTELAAARSLLAYARAQDAADRDPVVPHMVFAFAAEVVHRLRGAMEAHPSDFGDGATPLSSDEIRGLVCAALDEARMRGIGRELIGRRGVNNCWLPDELAVMSRESVRTFVRSEVAPHAERIHRHDEIVPEAIIQKMAELGYFGMSVPEEYGGGAMGNLVMIITTEELSAVSLAVAGSLSTRPEILTKALLAGGTEAQKRQWLPPIAAGKLMVGIAVTEPDTGSDVASVTCRAQPAEVGGIRGYAIDGAKAWCTFAGRADVLALLARTNPDVRRGAKGLSLFIVEKDPFTGHSFEMRQPHGGTLHGKADPTPGYRGMHSFTLNFENYFVPAEHLIGGVDGGEGRGFYLQMGGFAAGRLQTGGRATGLAQGALEATAAYANDRRQFGQPIGEFQLTQYKIGRMATYIAAARHLTYDAARVMDRDESRSLEPAQAKLFASDVAVWVTQEGQLLHGGWGYAEEFPISRYVVDALVLPIFEGVKPILELKVIARALLA